MMGKHASKPYNPNIAHVFYLAGFIESWGRGIEKICKTCMDDGLPIPEYSINPGDIMIKFTAPEDRIVRTTNHRVTDKVTDKVTDRVTDRVTEKVTEKVTDKVTEKVTDNEQKLLDLISAKPEYTYKTLSDELSVSRKTISITIKSLKEKGIIRRIGSDTKGYWEII